MGQKVGRNACAVSEVETMDVDSEGQATRSPGGVPAGPREGSPAAADPSSNAPPALGASRREETPQPHTLATEQGGITMQGQILAMQADAQQQEHLVALISELLEETVQRNDSLGRVSALATFEGEKSPVTPSSYVRRIAKYGGCSPCCFAIGLIYLKRLKRRENTVCLTSYNFQRLFLVAVMLAAKFLDDSYYSNKHWAEVGGMSTPELNCLELEFLFRLGFSMALSREEYDDYTRLLSGDDSVVSVVPMKTADPAKEGMGDKTQSFTDVSAAAIAFF